MTKQEEFLPSSASLSSNATATASPVLSIRKRTGSAKRGNNSNNNISSSHHQQPQQPQQPQQTTGPHPKQDKHEQASNQQQHQHKIDHHQQSGLYGHRAQPRENYLDLLWKKHQKEPDTQSDFQGFVNLAFMMLVAATFQLALKSYLQHGYLVDLNPLYCLAYDNTNLTGPALLWISICLYSHIVYLLELIHLNQLIKDDGVHYTLYFMSQALLYVVSLRFITWWTLPPMIAGSLCVTLLCCSMKMHSFYATNRNLEKKKRISHNKASHIYPKNLSFSNFFYYMCAPTLVYEVVFPRSPRIRIRAVLKDMISSIACYFMIYVMLIQFVIPVLKEKKDVFSPQAILYDCIRLAIPSISMWVLGFYAFFHCTLNLLSELLRFADRRFYEDWWNAPTLEVFWRKWNRPVHEWMFRHVFLESVYSAKVAKPGAMLATFFFSALLHEVLFGVAFGVVRPWFFIAMLAQVPLMFINRFVVTKLTPRNQARWGNILVWNSLFIGQPLIELLYCREYFQANDDFFCTVPVKL